MSKTNNNIPEGEIFILAVPDGRAGEIEQTDEQKKALDGCEELFVDNLRHIAVFSAIEDAFTLRDMLNAISASAAQKPDRWVFLPKYCRMYINRYGI